MKINTKEASWNTYEIILKREKKMRTKNIVKRMFVRSAEQK